MGKRPVRKMAFAALLSAVFPGLGQFYNAQVRKGLGFLVGALVLLTLLLSWADLNALQHSALTGIPPENIGQLFLISLLLLALALWSIVDAGRVAARPEQR